jgi:acyl-coenzyme A thioesterase PaaI-like protein
MRYHVIGKQPNSKMCLVCGLKNAAGLKASFYELENNEVMAVCEPVEEHQSYPGRLHGGIVTALLDETIGRAIMTKYDGDTWGVTLEFTTRYKKPIPLEGELRVIGRIIQERRRFFKGTGELLLPDGSIAAEGSGKYLKFPLEEIADFDFTEQEWKITPAQRDPTEIDL